MSLYIRVVNRSRNNLNRKGALNMYAHISASPEKFLMQNSFEKVSPKRTLVSCLQKLQEKKRGQESVYPTVP